MFRNLSIRAKLEITFIAMLFLAGVFISIFVISHLKAGAEERFAQFKEEELAEAKSDLISHVKMGFMLLDSHYYNSQNPEYLQEHYGSQLENVIDIAQAFTFAAIEEMKRGEISKEEAQQKAVEDIKTLRFSEGSGYVWINNMEKPLPRMVMHPTVPELSGKIMDDPMYECMLTEPKHIGRAIVELCEREGEGFIHYVWPKPTKNGLTEKQPKLSFVRLIPEWNWVIGTGMYIDDAEKKARLYGTKEIEQVRWNDEEGYLWISDMGKPIPRMVTHPMLSDWNGKILDDPMFNHALGKEKNLFAAFVGVCEEKGGGFVEFLWPKLAKNGLTEKKEKIAYVKLFEPYNWMVGAEMYIDNIDAAIARRRAHLNAQINQSIFIVLFIIAGVLMGSSLIVFRLTGKIIIRPLQRATQMAHDIAIGILPARLKVTSHDEIGDLEESFNKIVDNSNEILQQTQAIARGEYAIAIHPRSEKDLLSFSLISATEALREFHEESEKQNWHKTGLNELNECMRGEMEINSLAGNVLAFLTRYINIPIGTFFVSEDSHLCMVSCHAGGSIPDQPNCRFKLGEGLVGQVAADKELRVIEQVPDSYFTIKSSLGEAKPHSILLLPLCHENETVGVLELGSLESFNDSQISFLKQAAEQIATTIFSARSRKRVNSLLQETQGQSRELENQQKLLKQINEELLQNNEELTKRTDLLEKKQTEINQQNMELKRAAVNLQRATTDLEIASRYKSEFLANMSHELRTPLNSLLILSKLLMENKAGNLTEKQTEFAKTIYQSGSGLLQLINDILDLAKVEAGKIEFVFEEIKVEEICSSLEKTFEPIATEKQLSFSAFREEGVPESIRSDNQRIIQILTNLLSNAFKFTEQGEVYIRAYKPEEGSSPIEDTAIAFEVQDSGTGISEEKQKIVFEAFKQADGTISRKHGGTGLGLSISREFAKCLGGTIELESLPDEGSKFTLYLPETPPEPKESHASQEKEQSPISSPQAHQHSSIPEDPAQTQDVETPLSHTGDGTEPAGSTEPQKSLPVHNKKTEVKKIEEVVAEKNILIVDDDMRNAYALSAAFEEKRVHSSIASNGKKAVEQLENNGKFDLVLMDITMPEMDGYEAMRRIRQNIDFEQLPIIALTAKAMKGDREKCIAAGASDYLSKPVDLDKLFSTLQMWLDK